MRNIDVNLYRPMVLKSLQRFNLTPEERQDLTQETLVHLHTRIAFYDENRFKEPGPFFRICATNFINGQMLKLGDRKSHECSMPDESSVEEGNDTEANSVDRLVFVQMVQRLISKSTDRRTLEIGLAYYYELMKTEEVLERFGISERQFWVQIAKFRRNGRRILEPLLALSR